MTDLVSRLGARIRHLRQQHPTRMTQEELAERAGLSTSYVSMLERGQRTPHLDALERLAGALGAPLHDVFPGERASDEDALFPLIVFARQRKLKASDVERLLLVARGMFPEQSSSKVGEEAVSADASPLCR